MTLGEVLVLLLILVPLISGIASLVVKGRNGRYALVLASAGAMIVLATILFAWMTATGTMTGFSIDAGSILPASALMQVADYVLLLAFLYLGVRERSALVLLFGAINLLAIGYFQLFLEGAEQQPVLLVDALSITLALVSSIIGGLICIYSLKYMERDERQRRFFAVMLAFIGVMNGAVFSNSLVWMVVFWEATTLCSYLLIGHDRTPEARKSATRALVYTLGGGVGITLGIILAYHYYGTVLLSALPKAAVGFALLPIALLAFAAFTKAAQVPFQSWLLGAMVAPTPVSALLHSSTMVNLGVYLLLRMSGQISSSWELLWPVALVGSLSFMATSLLAIAQSNAKRVLAYSTIGNLGLITVCAAIGGQAALFAGVILLLFHAISKALLFLTVGLVKHETGSEDIEGMAGLRTSRPFVSLCLLVGIFTVLLPPFGMFASKWLISEIALDFVPIAFLLAIGFGASVVFYGKWLGRAFASGPVAERPGFTRERISVLFSFTLGLLMLGAVSLSLLLGYVAKYLVQPFVGPLPASLSIVNSPFGVFPFIALFLVMIFAVLLASYYSRPHERHVSDAYTGGEPFAFELASPYYLPEHLERQLSSALSLIAVALVLALVLLPALQGVFGW
ncbi:MAG TPA: proton-conducting transporter membrane subunit [Methanomassiliicoccales archaeon]|nr:proton-conducting transporter membrane subunit [Methanomassiliicoccales archaeon]